MIDLNYILEDDNTTYGGVAYDGETLGDFLEEVGMSGTQDINAINNALQLCGIKKIK